MKKCKFCLQNFKEKDYRQIFCNHSCAAKFNNKGIRRYGNEPSNCKLCQSQLERSNSKFCSRECEHEYQWQQTKKKIESGKKTSANSLRKYLFEVREYKCEICKGISWFGKPMPLIMDHINGDPSNDLPSNLRLICPNCDRFLPTFGSRNNGNGRKSKGIKRGSQL